MGIDYDFEWKPRQYIIFRCEIVSKNGIWESNWYDSILSYNGYNQKSVLMNTQLVVHKLNTSWLLFSSLFTHHSHVLYLHCLKAKFSSSI